MVSELKGTQSGPGLFLLLAKCHSGVTRLFSKVTGRSLRIRALILPPPLCSKAPARHGKETVLGKDSGLTQIVRRIVCIIIKIQDRGAVTESREKMVGFTGDSDGTESACNAGDLGSIPGLEIPPGEGNGNLLQYSCLGNPTDRGAW